MRKGFSLITAVIFLVTIATLGALALSISTLSVKKSTDNFLYQQANLLVDSGINYALLAMSGHDYNTSCLNQVNMTYNNTFDINVTIHYIGNGLPSGCNTLDDNLSTADSNRTVILDTFVSVKDGIVTEPIRVHRRTLQKP
ncbi:type II secretion system protein [Sulfurospirillum sp. 1307]|jgi:type II secretory pathway pseudopilin PulG